jgi:dihydroflavonol-4-reductase
MRKAFVTGATGFIGGALVQELLADGVETRVLVRKGADREAIDGLDVEIIEGDLLDAGALARGLVGCDACFHVAGMFKLYLRGRGDIHRIYETNDRGAGLVLRTAAQAGCDRIVHTSTASILRPVKGRPSNEDDLADESELNVHYQRSKRLGEQRALELAEKGAPIVIVSPSGPVGPGDRKPTPTGGMIRGFLRRKLPAYTDSGLNLIDVQDCARGHILAAQKGKPGRRYILGGENLKLAEIFALLEEISGVPAPRHKVPRMMALLIAAGSEFKARFTGRDAIIPLAAARMLINPLYFDNARAVAELGLSPRPIRKSLERAVEWFNAME